MPGRPDLRADRRTLGAAPLSARAPPLPALPPEIAFLSAYGLAPALLARAALQATTLGIGADEVLRAEGLVDEGRFYRYLAHHLGVDFTLARPPLVETATLAGLRAGIGELAARQGPRFLVAPTGAALSALLQLRASPAQRRASLLVTTPTNFAALVRDATGHELAGAASYGLARADPALSAAPGGVGAVMRGIYVGLLLAFVGAGFAAALLPAAALLGFSTLLLSAVVLRLCVCAASCGLPESPRVVPLSDAELPRYTLLIPLYREARVVPALHAAIEALDYPRGKLDIKFIIEVDDPETQAALRALPLSAVYDIVIAPPGMPRTKPRALNAALALARGDLIAVFDAEDEPEPGQLREAAARLRAAPPEVACLQARLTLYNAADSWLTTCFALDYAVLFDVTNPGLAALRLPLPLGGTSNHFRADVLRRIGGWDAWNVTEDADLGLRLARFGYRTEVFASTTAEEAPPRLAGWFRQRRRWFKGWQQTQMTLARTPDRLVHELGAWRALLTALLLVAQVQGPLLWPVSTLLLLVRLASGDLPTPPTLLELLAVTSWAALIVAGFGLTVFSTWLGMRRRRLVRLWPWLPVLPVYKLMVSLAAWASVLDLIRRPHWWDKTEHGLTRRSPPG